MTPFYDVTTLHEHTWLGLWKDLEIKIINLLTLEKSDVK